MTTNNYHVPVLLRESIEGLDIKPNGVYVDVTYGSGGHSSEIVKNLDSGKLFAFDQDEDALQNKIEDKRFTLIHANFSFFKNFLALYNIEKVDGILADLGVSSHQINTPERGFSTRFDGPLDLRMNKNNPLTAGVVVNTYEFENLKMIFKMYGDLQHAGKIAETIVNYRNKSEIATTTHLKEALNGLCQEHKKQKFFAQVFQSLRIEVNNEIDNLKNFLLQTQEVLLPQGRLVVISYHSAEDRLVKNFMRSGNFEGEIVQDFYGNKQSPFKLITKKPIVAGEDELVLNKRARSAKLRIAEII